MLQRRGIAAALAAAVAASWCAGGALAHEAYPPGGEVVTKALDERAWANEDFEAYDDGAVIETERQKRMRAHLDVTSGTLTARREGEGRYGFTSDEVFRVVACGVDERGARVKWGDQAARYRGRVRRWHADPPAWAGLHVFARYDDSHNLYVASLRYDGTVTIKRKWDSDGDGEGEYTTLAQARLDRGYVGEDGRLKTDRWYALRFILVGDALTFEVDGRAVLTATDGTFAAGTTGIRTDFADVELDDWALDAPATGNAER